ncbi:hypothetical protein PUN28_010279 [Cardiocondyla obscurior]|uniref:Uncharacterized protein n=1 Tax=Cardiocondyla obscurior TaxID=286306 RepID=A0AAW2FPG7_9HYME
MRRNEKGKNELTCTRGKKEGKRGCRRGSRRKRGGNSRRETGRKEREVGSVTEQDQCTTRTLRVPPPFAHPPGLNSHPAIPPPSSRVARSPCTGGTTTRARGGRDWPGRRGADCIRYNRTSTSPSAADMQADAPPWPLTTANALSDLPRL